MAEIILPPEENEETPQVPELNIDKPTENSKVITIEFEAKKTNKVSTKDTNQQLYTTDTDAWFEFKETSLEGVNGTYSVVFRNRHDGSIFQRTGDVVNGVAYYKIPHQEIRHAGAWRGQIVYTLSNGDTTAREFDYDVKGHILDGKDVREIVVEDFETLMAQLRSMKENAESELADLTQELRNINDTAEQNETDRQAFFDDLVEDIDDLQANYQELLDTGVLQTNINTKLEQLEEEYTPKLTEVTAQLAQTDGRVDNLVLEYDIDPNKDPEIIDARKSVNTGITYDLLGQRIDELEAELNEEIADMKNEGVLTYSIEVANKYYYNPDIEIDTDLNTITIPNHEFVEGESISFHSDVLPSGNLPRGVVEGELYTVKDVNNDTFKLDEVTLTSDGANDLDRAWFVSTNIEIVRGRGLELHSGHIRIIGRVWLAKNEMVGVSLNNSARIPLTNSGKYVEFDFIAKIDDEFNERVRVTGVAMSETESRLLDGIIRGGNLGNYGDKNIYAINITSVAGDTRIAGNSYLEVYDLG